MLNVGSLGHYVISLSYARALSHRTCARTMVQLIYHIFMHVDHLHRKISHAECMRI